MNTITISLICAASTLALLVVALLLKAVHDITKIIDEFTESDT